MPDGRPVRRRRLRGRGLVVLLAAVVPLTQPMLHDARGEITGGRLLYEVTVVVVLLTAIPEEFAFRGVLLGSATALVGATARHLARRSSSACGTSSRPLQTMSETARWVRRRPSVAGRLALVAGAVVP